jgi:hypothetical protein
MQIITTSPGVPIVCLYGTHGIGKSTFGSQCPKPIFIQTEEGLGNLGVQAFPHAEHLKDVHDALDHLLTEKHDYKTMVLDSLDWLEKLVFADAAASVGKTDIADIGFGRGYRMAEVRWLELLKKIKALNKKGTFIVLLAHCKIVKFEDPERDNYDRYSLDLYQGSSVNIADMIAEFVDVLAFANYKVSLSKKEGGFGAESVKAKGAGERMLFLEERPAYVAKNRYGMEPCIPFTYAAFMAEYKAKMRKTPAPVGNLAALNESKMAQERMRQEKLEEDKKLIKAHRGAITAAELAQAREDEANEAQDDMPGHPEGK